MGVFVEYSTKVVEYGVRGVSDPMEGDFIIFSKCIPSCILLLGVWINNNRDLWVYVEDKALWFRIG